MTMDRNSTWKVSLQTGETVVCRLATCADYRNVLNMGGVYNGFDYVPDLYHHFVHSSNAYLLCAELNGKLVAFRILQVLEGCRRLLGLAARTLDSHKNKKIMTYITNRAIKVLKQVFPLLESFVTVSVISPTVKHFLDVNKNIKTISKWKWMILRGSLGSLKKTSEARSSRQAVHLLEPSRAAGMAINGENLSSLGECPLLATGAWIPYDMAQSDVVKLSKMYDVFYSGPVDNMVGLSMSSVFVFKENGWPAMVMSAGLVKSLPLLLDHLAKAIESAGKVVRDNGSGFYIHLHFSPEIDSEEVVAELDKQFQVSQVRPEIGLDYNSGLPEVGFIAQAISPFGDLL